MTNETKQRSLAPDGLRHCRGGGLCAEYVIDTNKGFKTMARAFMTGMIIALMMLAQSVRAEAYLYAGAWSDHPFSEGEYNETHNLAAIEYGSVVAGYFKNSYNEDSFVTGYRFKRAWGDLEASLLFGATYGYRHCVKGMADRDRRVCPVAVPMVAYTKYRVQPGVMVLGNAVAVTVRFEL